MSAAIVWEQPDLPFFDPMEPRIVPQDGTAHFTLNWLSPAGRLNQQRAFQVDELETVLHLTAGKPDLFISQCFLDQPVRKSPHVQYGTHAFVDLDTYKIPELAVMSRNEVACAISKHCDDTGTPNPSAIISSGRGFYAKWFYSSPVGRAGVGQMMAVNRALVRRLERFGADRKATDCTRILRVTGSKHTGVGRVVELLHLEQRDGHTIRYDFDILAREVAPSATAEPDVGMMLSSVANIDHEARTQRGGRMFTREGWHWAIVEDLRMLARMRWGGIVLEGWRDIFGHVLACQLARIFHPGQLRHEIMAHSRLMLPADYVAHDLVGHCSTLLGRAREGGIYRYRKNTLIDLLQIAPAEERHMTALISEAEKRRREMAQEERQRRAAGMIPRIRFEGTAVARRPMVAERRARGMTWRAIGADLGISEAEARRLAQPG